MMDDFGDGEKIITKLNYWSDLIEKTNYRHG